MRKIFGLFLITGLLFVACNSKSTTQSDNGENTVQEINTSTEVPYSEALRYFVNNTYSESGIKVLTTKDEFDTIFSPAPVMGKGGLPTKIDFNTSYIIAIIGEKSNKAPEIKVNSLSMDGENILLNYSIEEKEETSYTIQPALILIVDNKYQGKLKTAIQ